MVYRMENLFKVINDIRKRHDSDRNKTSRILRALSGVKKMFHKESQQYIRNMAKSRKITNPITSKFIKEDLGLKSHAVQ